MASIERRGAAWRARVRVKGQIATRTFDTEAEALEWATAAEGLIASGTTGSAAKAATPGRMTVAELFDRYAREISPTKRGQRWEVIRLARLGREIEGSAADLDGPKLAEWRDKRLRQVSASSVNRELNLISAVYTRAIKEWRLPVPANPASLIMWPRKPKPRSRRVSDAERDAICRALEWDGITKPETLRQLVAWATCFAIETMMRQGEILGLTWRHVHEAACYCHLPQTKNGDARDVPLSSRALALLALIGRRSDGNKVCEVDGGTFGVYFRKACKDAGLSNLHFHDTRREATTRLAPKFGNALDLASASGHKDVNMIGKTYYAPTASDLAKRLG